MVDAPWPIAPPLSRWAGATTIWLVELDGGAARSPDLAAVLSPEERARAARFQREADRDRFLSSHAALRLILSRALATAPGAISLSPAEAGKPRLAGAYEGRLQFNLSHSGERALVGLADAAIGVDIEATRPLPDALRIARSHFHPGEVAAIAAQAPEQDLSAFYGCWTRKEAFVKAVGAGLAMPLDRFAVSVPPAPPALLSCEATAGLPDAWTLHHLAPENGYVGAVVIAGRAAPCARLRLAPDWFGHL